MKKVENFVINGSKKKPIILDVIYHESTVLQPIVIFCHGSSVLRVMSET